MTGRGDTGLSKAPAHGVTETGRQEESHRNSVEGTDRNEGPNRREAQRRKIARAQELYLEGDVSKQCYLIIKENADAELTTIYVPELDDVAEAVEILTDLNELWKSADPGQRNRLLLAVFHSVYVDLENREVVGFRPVKAFHALLQAMDYREDVEVWPTPYGEFSRDGGDGGGLAPAFATGAILVDFKQSLSSGSVRGERIKHVRKSEKTSQKRFADSLEIDERTLRRWERGETAPNSKNQRALVERSINE